MKTIQDIQKEINKLQKDISEMKRVNRVMDQIILFVFAASLGLWMVMIWLYKMQ